jgi:hypothetical protein
LRLPLRALFKARSTSPICSRGTQRPATGWQIATWRRLCHVIVHFCRPESIRVSLWTCRERATLVAGRCSTLRGPRHPRRSVGDLRDPGAGREAADRARVPVDGSAGVAQDLRGRPAQPGERRVRALSRQHGQRRLGQPRVRWIRQRSRMATAKSAGRSFEPFWSCHCGSGSS